MSNVIDCGACGKEINSDKDPTHFANCKCSHEGELLYGKVIRINKQNRVIQVECTWCDSYGTVYEQREKHDSNDAWYEVREIWHEPKDYHNVA